MCFPTAWFISIHTKAAAAAKLWNSKSLPGAEAVAAVLLLPCSLEDVPTRSPMAVRHRAPCPSSKETPVSLPDLQCRCPHTSVSPLDSTGAVSTAVLQSKGAGDAEATPIVP